MNQHAKGGDEWVFITTRSSLKHIAEDIQPRLLWWGHGSQEGLVPCLQVIVVLKAGVLDIGLGLEPLVGFPMTNCIASCQQQWTSRGVAKSNSGQGLIALTLRAFG